MSQTRLDVLTALRYVRRNCHRPRTAWDTCVVAAVTHPDLAPDAYRLLQSICIKFRPSPNAYLG
jgi:hypothetical protein